MTTPTDQLVFNFEQVLSLVRQLSPSEKAKLRQELEQEQQVIDRVILPVQTRTQTFKDLMAQVQPVAPDFDPDAAKAEYLQEKHGL